MKKTTIALGIATVLVVFGAHAWSLYVDARDKWFKVTLASSVAGTAQLYYDLGNGFTESHSSQADVERTTVYREYQFILRLVDLLWCGCL